MVLYEVMYLAKVERVDGTPLTISLLCDSHGLKTYEDCKLDEATFLVDLSAWEQY